MQITDCWTSNDLQGFLFREQCMRRLSAIDGYDWCGVYRLEGDALVLDAFVGAETQHTSIPVGSGVCGAAVEQNKNQIVHDVTQCDDYLSCSLETKSEIVVLIKRDGTTLGEIDIDSHRLAAFTSEDERFLEGVGALIADRWDEDPEP
ncbi:MAG: GAF domain-containing protein [Armatimonadetes bacterium]|nr:GAF domain-containing protein [Armatimonadota bacterium]